MRRGRARISPRNNSDQWNRIVRQLMKLRTVQREGEEGVKREEGEGKIRCNRVSSWVSLSLSFSFVGVAAWPGRLVEGLNFQLLTWVIR